MHSRAFAAIFDALPDPALLVRGEPSGEPRVALANPAAREALPAMIGQAMLASVIRRPEVLDIVEATLRRGVAGEAVYQSGGAQDRRMQAITRPLPADEDGAPLALLILRDETEALRNERMRADFLANASHELKTPLASLSGFIETLRGHAKDDPVARERFLGVMADQADRMGRLIADLLSLSRIELDEHIPPSGEVDLALAALDVADSLQPLAAKADVRVEISGAGPASIIGDRHQVLQVLQNLIENALKYTSPGGVVHVEVETDRMASDLSRVRNDGAPSRTLLAPDLTRNVRYASIRIADFGPGISREHLPRLTERFYRAPGQKSGETSGTGLGLAIVKHIINRHKGGLFVESEPGAGAAFTAYFPQIPLA